MPKEHRFFFTIAPPLPITVTHTQEETPPAWVRDSTYQHVQRLHQHLMMRAAIRNVVVALWKVRDH